MSDYVLLEPDECIGFFELKPFPNAVGIQDIVEKRLIGSHVSMPSSFVVAHTFATKPISASDQIFDANKNSFDKLKEILLEDKEFVNKFVAVIDGEMVDSDFDRSALAERMYAKYGYIPLFIGKVAKGERYRHLPSPRRVKD
jgi:hypothetical protein